MNIMQQSACLVLKPIRVYSYTAKSWGKIWLVKLSLAPPTPPLVASAAVHSKAVVLLLTQCLLLHQLFVVVLCFVLILLFSVLSSFAIVLMVKRERERERERERDECNTLIVSQASRL